MNGWVWQLQERSAQLLLALLNAAKPAAEAKGCARAEDGQGGGNLGLGEAIVEISNATRIAVSYVKSGKS